MRPWTLRRIATRTLGNPSGFPSDSCGARLGPRPPRSGRLFFDRLLALAAAAHSAAATAARARVGRASAVGVDPRGAQALAAERLAADGQAGAGLRDPDGRARGAGDAGQPRRLGAVDGDPDEAEDRAVGRRHAD